MVDGTYLSWGLWLTLALGAAVAFVWCYAARRSILMLDRELQAANIVGQMAILKLRGLDWYREELYTGSSSNKASRPLFAVMQLVWPEDTERLTVEWAVDTDPSPQEEPANERE